jgi:alpha-beta hydrolase superfamily lysophospholipase
MRTPIDQHFRSNDGNSIYYRHWPACRPNPAGAIVLFHRGHEHSGRLQHVVDELDLPGYAMFAWDARGHGLSYDKSDDSQPSLGTFVKDVDCFVRHICCTHGFTVEDIAVIGQSVGSVLLAAWAHDYAPKIRCMSLAAPAFQVKLYVPLARPALAIASRLFGEFHVNSYVKPTALTHDPERIASYQTDPLIRRPISAKVLLALYSTAGRIIADAQAIRVPTQMLISGSDWVVHHQPQLDFFARLGSRIKECHDFPGFYHDTLGEKDRHLAIGKVRDFITRMYEQPPAADSLLDSDTRGYTKREFDRLERPLPVLSPRALAFRLMRRGLARFSRLSDGLRLGFRTGFDSGSTLDYIYGNKPSGITPLGRLIDWFYLNSIGWRGIRLRRQSVESLLHNAIARLRASGRPVRILDIAAGHGRYILSALDVSTEADHVLLRDYSEINVVKGRALIHEKGLDAVAEFEQADAFDRQHIASVDPPPTLGVISGLYELIPENGPVRNSLAGLGEAIERGGYLIYTGQPWHPQLEMIARVLPSHRGLRPWVMRRRTQAELDQLVEEAGFRKLDQLTDDWGIFTVSIAQRA